MNKELTILEEYEKLMKEWQSGHSVDFSQVRIKIEKSLRALEIIKNKEVCVSYLFHCFKCYDLREYNDLYSNNKLTQEEYDLLKEVLL